MTLDEVREKLTLTINSMENDLDFGPAGFRDIENLASDMTDRLRELKKIRDAFEHYFSG